MHDVTKLTGISSYAYLGRMAGVPSPCSTHGMKMNWQEHWLYWTKLVVPDLTLPSNYDDVALIVVPSIR